MRLPIGGATGRAGRQAPRAPCVGSPRAALRSRAAFSAMRGHPSIPSRRRPRPSSAPSSWSCVTVRSAVPSSRASISHVTGSAPPPPSRGRTGTSTCARGVSADRPRAPPRRELIRVAHRLPVVAARAQVEVGAHAVEVALSEFRLRDRVPDLLRGRLDEHLVDLDGQILHLGRRHPVPPAWS